MPILAGLQGPGPGDRLAQHIAPAQEYESQVRKHRCPLGLTFDPIVLMCEDLQPVDPVGCRAHGQDSVDLHAPVVRVVRIVEIASSRTVEIFQRTAELAGAGKQLRQEIAARPRRRADRETAHERNTLIHRQGF